MALYKLTIDHTKVEDTLTNFPIYVNLNHVKPGGLTIAEAKSIRVYKSDGTTQLPREVVSENEMHFLADSVSHTQDTVFLISIDGISDDYDRDDTFGSEAVWADYKYVSHDGGRYDSTAGKNHGTGHGGITMGAAVSNMGVATEFDGVDDYIALGNVGWGISDGTNKLLTIQAWGYFSDPPNKFWWFESNENHNPPFDNPPYGGHLFFVIQDQRNFPVDCHYNVNPFISNEWIKLDGVADGTNMTGYSNAKIGEVVSYNSIAALTERPELGNWKRSMGRHFEGKLGEIRILKKALSEDWIKTEYENQSNPQDFYTIGSAPGKMYIETGSGLQHVNPMQYLKIWDGTQLKSPSKVQIMTDVGLVNIE